MRLVTVLAATLAGAATTLRVNADEPFSFRVGAGASLPLADAGDRFDAGWSLAAGANWHASERFGLRLDYLYADHDVSGERFDADLDASHTLQHAALGLELGTRRGASPRFYVVGGPALFFRAVEIRRFEGTRVERLCDPWLLRCTTDIVPVETLVGSRDATDWGLHGGVGVAFRASGRARLFLEARYLHVLGDGFAGRSSDARYVPILLGVEF